MNKLIELQCSYGQGNYFSVPVTGDAAEQQLRLIDSLARDSRAAASN